MDSSTSPINPVRALDVLGELPAAVLLVRAGHVQYVNARAAAILGRPVSELVSCSLVDVLGVTSLDLSHSEAGERGELEVRLPKGQRRTIGFTAAPCGDDMQAVVFQDTSQVARLRDERDRLMRLAAIGEALPSLLHELKNPLAAIMTTVEVLLEELSPGEMQTDLHAVLTELRRMALSFEGIGAIHGTLGAPRPEAVDYACREACRVLEARARNKGIEFVHLVERMPLLPLQSAVIRGLVFNFVTNAIHACEPGAAVRLEAGYDERHRRLELSVVDTGAGMSPEVLEHATDLFFTTKASGSGIGLALCKRLVDQAGGEMRLKSVPGFGTMVHMSIPVDPPEPVVSEPSGRRKRRADGSAD